MTAHTHTAPGQTPYQQPFERSRTNRALTLLRGRLADPAWVRPPVLALLLATAVLYLWGLEASGYANSFYSAVPSWPTWSRCW